MTTIHPSDDPMQLADTAWGRSIGLSPAEQSTLTMADATCSALFGTSTVTETAHSIMQDAKRMTSASPATAPIDDLDERQTAMVLHALRVYQELRLGARGDCYLKFHPTSAATSSCEHFDDMEPLTSDEIDTLCERLNYGVEVKSPAPDADVQ